MKRLTLAYAAFLALVVFAADAGMCRPFFNLVNDIPSADKLGHCVLMGTLAFLTNASLGWRTIGRGRLLAGSLIVLAIVTAEECSQVFFKTRTFDLLDLGADCVGIAIASRFASFSKSQTAAQCARMQRR